MDENKDILISLFDCSFVNVIDENENEFEFESEFESESEFDFDFENEFELPNVKWSGTNKRGCSKSGKNYLIHAGAVYKQSQRPYKAKYTIDARKRNKCLRKEGILFDEIAKKKENSKERIIAGEGYREINYSDYYSSATSNARSMTKDAIEKKFEKELEIAIKKSIRENGRQVGSHCQNVTIVGGGGNSGSNSNVANSGNVVLECGITVAQINLLQNREFTAADYELLLSLDDSVKPKTMTLTQMNKLLPESKYEKKDDDDDQHFCSVCQMTIENDDAVRKITVCRHLFHSDCISTWLLTRSQACPCCMHVLLPN